MSDTPISDSTPHNVADLGMLCRRLERQLNASTSEIERLTAKVAQLYEGAEEQNQRIKRLEDAGNELSKLLGFSIGNDEDVEWACSLRFQNLARCDRAISEWAKAKEAKP